MLIIIEGVDGVGKTTLVETLRGLTGGRTLHAAQPRGNWHQEYVEPISNYVPTGMFTSGSPGGREHLILDRWHWGELIYGPLYRGQSIVDDSAWNIINTYLNALGAIVVYLSEDKDVVLSRWRKRGEDFARQEHYDWIVERYAAVASASTVPVVRASGTLTRSMIHRMLTVAMAFEECMVNERRWAAR